MCYVNRRLLAVPLAAGLVFAQLASAETWTDVTGKHSIEAKFLSASGGNIYLQKADGTRIAVPISKLSPESVEQAKRLYRAALSSDSGTPAPAVVAPSASGSTGASKLGDNPTAQETADALTLAFAEFDMVTIWDAFPAKHQQDIEEVIRLAATSIDPPMWNSVASMLKKATRLVSEKKEFFMNNPMIGSSIPKTPETDEIWDATAEMLRAYTDSTITDQVAMKSFSMSQFIANDVPKMQAAFARLRELTEKLQDSGSPFGQMSEVPQIELVSESASEAVFKITQNGEVQEQTFVKSGNRWIPKEMVEGWDEGIAKAKADLAKLATPEGKQGMMQAQMMLGMVGAPIDQLLAANTQEEFDAVVGNLAGMAMGMMGGFGGGPGGPGGPPPGFGGGPPPGFGDGPPPGFGDGPPPGFGDGPPPGS